MLASTRLSCCFCIGLVWPTHFSVLTAVNRRVFCVHLFFFYVPSDESSHPELCQLSRRKNVLSVGNVGGLRSSGATKSRYRHIALSQHLLLSCFLNDRAFNVAQFLSSDRLRLRVGFHITCGLFQIFNVMLWNVRLCKIDVIGNMLLYFVMHNVGYCFMHQIIYLF